MVFTRSKARQKANETAEPVTSESENPLTSQLEGEDSGRSVRTRRTPKEPKVRVTRLTKSEAKPPRAEDGVATESLEDLALRALRAMKSRLKVDSTTNGSVKKMGEQVDAEEDGMETVDYGMETDGNVQPDVILLESDTKKKSIPNRLSRTGVMVTSLQPRMKEKPYFSYSSKSGVVSVSSSTGKQLGLSWGETEEELLKKSVITSDFEKKETAPPMYVSKYAKAKARKEAREKSTGSGWYEMQAPEMTAELKNDLKLLRMRGALDPSQHYKASDWKKLPRYFEVGKMVSGPAEFYSSRVPKRQRKQTIMDELLQDHQFKRYQKKKYSDLQRKFKSGTRRKKFIKHKKHYKK
jgi:hypothetical protein